jgi:hypothetical protein
MLGLHTFHDVVDVIMGIALGFDRAGICKNICIIFTFIETGFGFCNSKQKGR